MPDWKTLLDTSKRPPTPPTKEIITAIAREKLARQAMGELSPLTYAQKIAQQWIDDATSDDAEVRLPSRKELMDRIEGRVPQALAHTGAEGGPIQHEDVSAESIYRRIAGIAARTSEGSTPGRANGNGGTTH